MARKEKEMETWELTKEEKEKLSGDDIVKYDTAVRYKKDGWAYGSYGGWARGNEILISLGWREVEKKEGHRTFIQLIKPQGDTDAMSS